MERADLERVLLEVPAGVYCMFTSVKGFIFTCWCIYIYIYTSVYAYIYICVCVCIYI